MRMKSDKNGPNYNTQDKNALVRALLFHNFPFILELTSNCNIALNFEVDKLLASGGKTLEI